MAPRTRRPVNGAAPADEVMRLRTELAARMAETEWLKSHYEQHLREAMSNIEMLKSGTATRLPAPVDRSAEDEELRQLRQEVQRLQAAEARYLDRIAELKEKAGMTLSASGVGQ
ncbi:MAG: hypothetical protein QE280_12540 [Caulobacter sp.]|nr:hypothetical protein [Caulobacter sp.]